MTQQNEQAQALSDGIHDADPDKAKEYADVARWLRRIDQTRQFDEEARKQYAKDRRYARGDSGFEVDANIVGTFIDISESFLFAKQPDVDVLPAKQVEPPTLEVMLEAAEVAVQDEAAAITETGRQAFAAAIARGFPTDAALAAGQMAENMAEQEAVNQRFEQIRSAYEQRQRDAKAFAETLELVISRKWQQANIKRRGRKCARSGLTVALGILMPSFQERTGPSPQTTTAINDLQQNIARAAAMRAEIDDEAQGRELDAKLAEYERQLETLRAKPEAPARREYVIDNVAPEDFVVAPGYAIADHCDAPWNARRIPMLFVDAQAAFALDEEQMKGAVRYSARKPEMVQNATPGVGGTMEATDADAYISGAQPGETGQAEGDFVMVWEIWDRDTNSVLTAIEGVKCWARPAWHPNATSRFYPFFVFATSEVDGQRHPQSLVSRSAKLIDEFYRIKSAEAEHRRRVRPKTMFNAGAMAEGEAEKLAKGLTQEMVAINTTLPKADLRGLLVPVTYAALDAALYDTSRIWNEMERIWGIQEALSGGVQSEKTATEAEIQQSGFQARMGGRRDALDAMLNELAQYTAELLRAKLTHEEVVAIAGPAAFWPEYAGPGDLEGLVTVEIRAGSSGKPNTAAERQAWATLLPILQNGVTMIGQLRGSTPLDLADAQEKLLRLTVERAGDRIDLDALLPKAPPAQPMGMPGMPGMPGAPGAPMPADPMNPEPVPGGEPPPAPAVPA